MSFKEQAYAPFNMKKDWHKAERKVKKTVTNAEYAKSDVFQAACSRAKIEPTKRQASKYRNGRGLAFKHKGINPNGPAQD